MVSTAHRNSNSSTYLLTNSNFKKQPDFLTKKVKNLDKRNFNSRERFSVWHEAKCKNVFNC